MEISMRRVMVPTFYRKKAAECARLAKFSPEPVTRQTYKMLARQWSAIAAFDERNPPRFRLLKQSDESLAHSPSP